MTTRIAILGDLHGNLRATEAALAAIDAERPGLTLCLGDLVGYGAHPNEVIDRIRARNIPVLLGNYDDGVGFDRDDCGCAYRDEGERERGQQSLLWTRAAVSDDRKAWLRTLPFDWRGEAHGVRVRAVHGSPRRINEYLFEDRDPASLERIATGADCDVLLFGHTHKAVAQIGINLGAIFNYVRKQLGQRCTETRFHELRPVELLGFWLDHLSGKSEELRPYLCESLRLIQTNEQH